MSGNEYLIDTNIVLYLMKGDKTLAEILHHQKIYLSFISELELLGYRNLSEKDLMHIENFISDCVVIDINQEIKRITIDLRRKSHLKLPDCIIAATSIYLNVPFLTADADFKSVDDLLLILYELT